MPTIPATGADWRGGGHCSSCSAALAAAAGGGAPVSRSRCWPTLGRSFGAGSPSSPVEQRLLAGHRSVLQLQFHYFGVCVHPSLVYLPVALCARSLCVAPLPRHVALLRLF